MQAQQTLIEKLSAKVEATRKQQSDNQSAPLKTETPKTSVAQNSTETRSFGPIKYNVAGSGFQRMLPDISVIANTSAAYYSENPTGQAEDDPEKTGFNLTEIEMAIQSIIDPYFKADIFLSFNPEGVEIEEAYATTTSLPTGLQVRAGKFKLPFGRQNQKHPHAWSFTDNPLVNTDLLGPEGGLNEVGLEISYLFPTPFFLHVHGTMSNGDNENNFNSDLRKDFLYQTRLSSSVDLSDETTLLFGASQAWGNNDTQRLTGLYGGDFLLKWKARANRSLTWQSEYMARRRDNVAGTDTDHGFYSYVDYQFLKRWHAGLRYDYLGFGSDTLEKQYRITPALTFTPTEFSLLRLQYDYNKTLNEDAVNAVFLQMQYNLGPHGAHAF